MNADHTSLPEDVEAERSLLATVCAEGAHNAALDCSAVLSEADFVHPAHRAVFRAMVAIVNKRPTDLNLLTLKAELELSGDMGRVGGFQGLVDLLGAEEVGRPMTLVKILQDHRKRRDLIRLGGQLVREATDSGDPASLVEALCTSLAGMVQSAGDKGPVPMGEVADDVLAEMLDEARGIVRTGLRVGFPRFDRLTRGFRPGQLIVIAARPAVGKTSLALNFALRAAKNAPGLVPFFTHEMTKGEVVKKVLIDIAGVNPRERKLTDPEVWNTFVEARDELNRLPLLVDDRSETTVRQIRAKVERLQARQQVSMVLIDYMQLVSSPEDSRAAKQNENARVSEISRQLKLMAKDCGVPVVVLSQLNREVEKRSGGKPQLSDLRDSGAIEQDADIVTFIHRVINPSLSPELQEKSGLLILAKHRGGPVGSIPVQWAGGIGRYTEEERETDSWSQPSPRVGRQEALKGLTA